MYVDKDVSVNQRFKAIIEHNYFGDVEELGFDDARKASQEINKWVAEATNGHIKDLVNEGSVSNSVVLLLNALYFQGTWRQSFNKTFNGPFLTSGGKSVDKSFIERTGNYYYFNSKLYDAKILRIPYAGFRYSMFFVLPNESNNIDSVVEKLDSTTLKNEVWHMDDLGECYFKVFLITSITLFSQRFTWFCQSSSLTQRHLSTMSSNR
jgi:serine protease inhibitor